MTTNTAPAPARPVKGAEFTPAGCTGPWKVTSVRGGRVYGTPATAYDRGSRTSLGCWSLAEFAAMTVPADGPERVVAEVKAAGIPSVGVEHDGIHAYTIEPEQVVTLIEIASRHGLRVDIAAGAVYRLAL